MTQRVSFPAPTSLAADTDFHSLSSGLGFTVASVSLLVRQGQRRTSFLSYAEIHAVLARKLKERTLRVTEYHWAATRFDSDWRTYLTRVELSQRVLGFVPDLVKRHPLKGSDAVQLASALWAASATQLGIAPEGDQKSVVFITSDRQLAGAAKYEQLQVFNPELV